jgi:DNA polymerase-3 subunit gamma/tau
MRYEKPRVSYLVLARKWRPQTFADLVGQEHVSTTLANAIAANRVAHAFLFTGVRGVGKTTSARIMAKALNCEKGPTASPCLSCAACREIAAGSDVDVQEIDGASYNGVDEIRRLQESLPYRPARDRYKVYIVDEVHMLSQNAWNAFLKTLEEPPPHVKFIFATTEVHKVPVTILSRCQRYDFKLIPTQLVAKRLRYVLEQESIAADDSAVTLIAREAAGSMRDGMSLLDQAIAWGGDKLVGEEVSRVLGVAARSVLHEISKALLAGDAAACLRVVGQLAEQGYDIAQIAKGLLSELRDLVVARVCKEPGGLLDLADDEAAEVTALANTAGADDLVRLHHGFSRSFDDVVRSAQPRAALEMLLVRLARRPPLLPIDDLIGRLAELERKIAGGAPAGGQTPARSLSSPASGASGGGGGERANASAAPASGPSSSPFRSPVSSPPTNSNAFATPSATNSLAPNNAFGPRASSRPLGVAQPASTQLTQAAGATALATSAPVSQIEPANGGAWRADLKAWRSVLERIRSQRSPLAAVLEHASPIAFSVERVVLGYEANSFLAAQATEASSVELLTREVRSYFGTPTPVAFDLTAGPRSSPSIAVIDSEERRLRLEHAKKAVAEHPIVRAAIEILGAELCNVRVTE